jgi:hypothetical protein
VSCPGHYLLCTATPEQVHAIVQATHNVLRGHIPLSERERKNIIPHTVTIYNLDNPDTPYKEKKQFFVQEESVFMSELLTPFLTALLML